MFENKLKKRKSLNESIKYIANFLVRLSRDGHGNVIGITSSLECCESKLSICEKICSEISNIGLKVCLINTDNNCNIKLNSSKKFGTKDYRDNESTSGLIKNIDQARNANDVVLVNIPCITLSANAVEYCIACDRVELIEKYMYSKYKDYEEALMRLNLNNIMIDGVIAY